MPPVATPTRHLYARPGADRQSRQAHLQVRGRAERDASTRTTWCSSTCSIHQGEQLWTDDHLPATPTSTVEAGPDGRVHPDRVRAELPVHRRGATCGIGLYIAGRRQAAGAHGAGSRRGGSTWWQVPAAAAVREHLPDLQGRLAPRRSRRRQPATPSGSGQEAATFSFRNPKKDVTFYLEYDARTDLFTPPQQVTIKIGDQVIDDVHGRLARAEAARHSRSPPRSSAAATWSRWRSTSTGPSSPVAAIPASSASASSTPSSSRSRAAQRRLGCVRAEGRDCSVSGQLLERMVELSVSHEADLQVLSGRRGVHPPALPAPLRRRSCS